MSDILIVIGLIAALVCIVLTDMRGFLKFALSFILKGWTIGMAICPIFPICFFTAVSGFAIAVVLFVALCTMLPVAITVYFYFFSKEK